MVAANMDEHTQPETRTTDGETRRQILSLLLKSQALSAVEIGQALQLSPTGIRRHLDNLLQEGTVAPTDLTVGGRGPKRGRPAKRFQLTEAGRAQFGHHYDDLATQALDMLKATGGEAAVESFAAQRAQAIVADVQHADFTNVVETAQALGEAFDRNGYQTTVQHAGFGIQICQHHCPIEHVAAKYPEICAAEQAAIAEVLGKHVQPLATIADGQTICTTNIPLHYLPLRDKDSAQPDAGALSADAKSAPQRQTDSADDDGGG